MGNEIPYYKEIHTLLVEWFVTFLRCIRMIGRASDSMDVFIMFDIMSFLPKMTLNFHEKAKCFAPSDHRKRYALI